MIELLAPAKLNVGLEIIGKRDDGYHDLRTLFCAVSLFDRISIKPGATTSVIISDPDLAEGNLVQRAIDAWDQAGLPRDHITVHIDKHIPVAAGLGGASSDAATMLAWLADQAGLNRSDPMLLNLVVTLGSDVPFFVRGGLQIGAGRGEVLSPLPFHDLAAVVITPRLHIAAKTLSLFAALLPEDWSDGSQVGALIAGFPDSVTETRAPLINTFQRPLYDLYPELGTLAQTIFKETGRHPSITGAGPSMYLPTATIEQARALHNRLSQITSPLDPSIVAVQAIPATYPTPDAHA